jgi:hypothetical protein
VQSFEETALELGMKFTLKDPVIMRGPDRGRPRKVGKPMARGELDDMATAMATMAAMLATKRKPIGFVQRVAIMNRGFRRALRVQVRGTLLRPEV